MTKSSSTDYEPAVTDQVIAQAYDDLKYQQNIEDQDISPPAWLAYGLILIFGAFFAFLCWLLIFYVGG